MTSLSECDFALCASLIGAAPTAMLCSLLALFMKQGQEEIQALLLVGSIGTLIALCFGGVFWKRNRELFTR
ncbi:MAG: hypothetical protein A3D65_06400 [Candidatus Lloydbacteria bacterium RIFCSPHIGHO2_02_FULL_50_13]|uniref:Uncharacterized protein n=1 Tax=Candidatus Lloydbacteria bacterium RIFCSPHIGHO2_02_FULL_50_13 TaxID=1798661 RepID=A0A1G2D390_9BACT|nr:MAG: hypothetical protein A3D65_06400 [Candidatus Lloydbacteria bacterium RIFCSPHIGHO2_02_FULL_50_13]